jgi:cell division protease FtsH
MFFKNIVIFMFFLNNIYSFKPTIHKKINVKLMDNNNFDFNNDLNLLHKYKMFFPKENYNDVIQDILNNKISKIYIDKKYNEMISVDNLPNIDNLKEHFHYTNINPIVIPNIIEKTSEHNIPINFVDFTPTTILNIQQLANDIISIVSYAFPILFVLSFLSSFYRRGNMPGMPPMPSSTINRGNTNFLNNNPFNFRGLQNENEDNENFNRPNVSLSSWAGSPEVIEECKEVISYIDKKEIFEIIGAEMPKGILLEGPPGTGKTLLAKAIATETNSTFISISGSEFVELFVGMGASRVRQLFDSARQNRPCIIFIDEIDAVGRQRGAGINMANDEREQTLNQLLYEMDGFNNNTDIIVLAATNRRDVLDQALLRPGRFDRIIRVPLPDKDSREKILDFYIKNKNTDGNLNIKTIAELTDGFSGAQLKNLINEAAILSARNNMTKIQERYVFEAFEKLIVGLIKNNANVPIDTKRRVAIHESGHALLSIYFNEYFEFKKASIQPTYNGAGGYTIFTEKPEIKEGGLYTKEIFKQRLVIILGGKAAESLYYKYNKVSLGAIEDLRQANKLAQRMIGNFGMGDKLEVFFNEDISDESNPFLGRSLALGDKYSQYTKTISDKESLNLVKEAYEEAKSILSRNYENLILLSDMLMLNTTISSNDINITNLF